MTTDRPTTALPTAAEPNLETAARSGTATAEGRLLLPRCDALRHRDLVPPRVLPRRAASPATSWFEACGRGHGLQLHGHPPGPGRRTATPAPYVLAYVELDEGPRMMTNIVDCDPDDGRTSARPVEVVFHDTGEGSALPASATGPARSKVVMSRLEQPRVPPMTDDEFDETKEIVARAGVGDEPYNIFRTLAHHPKLLKRWGVFGGHVLSKSTLPVRPRELAILRVGWLCQAEYEWAQHVRIARQAGFSDDDIARIARGPDADGWTDNERAILRATDEPAATRSSPTRPGPRWRRRGRPSSSSIWCSPWGSTTWCRWR